MKFQREIDPLFGELYRAGEYVPPGEYRDIRSGRVVELLAEDYLPASLDGQVACYRMLTPHHRNAVVREHLPRKLA